MIDPPPRLDHGRDRVLAAEEDAADVDGHHRIPGRDIGVDDRVVGLGHDPGVVVQAVEPAVRRERHGRPSPSRRPRSETSILTKVASPPAARTRSTVSAPAASLYSATTTLAPSVANIWAATRPMPAAAAGDDRHLVRESHRDSLSGCGTVPAPSCRCIAACPQRTRATLTARGASIRSMMAAAASSLRRSFAVSGLTIAASVATRRSRPARSRERPRRSRATRTTRRSAGSASRSTRPSATIAATSRVIVGGVTPSMPASDADRPRSAEDQDRQCREPRRRDARGTIVLRESTKEMERGRVDARCELVVGVARSRHERILVAVPN